MNTLARDVVRMAGHNDVAYSSPDLRLRVGANRGSWISLKCFGTRQGLHVPLYAQHRW